MQALVLAGGEGTRLRPLTLTVPKPVMPLAGRPFLTFMLDWLRRHGVDDVILSCGFMSHAVEEVLGDRYDGISLHHMVEDEPLGTGGPMRLAADAGLLQDRLLVLNGDVLTDMDLTAEIAQHEATGARATLALIAYDGCITSGARIGPLSVLGRHCSVGDRSVVERAVLHDSVIMGAHASVTEAIVGEGARLEDGAQVEPGAVIGAGAHIGEGAEVE